MSEDAPNLNPAEVVELEYDPSTIKVAGVIGVFEKHGRGDKFEQALRDWHIRMEKLADGKNTGPERTFTRVEINMFEAQIFFEIGDIDSAAGSFKAAHVMVYHDDNLRPSPESRGSDTMISLYNDINRLRGILEDAGAELDEYDYLE